MTRQDECALGHDIVERLRRPHCVDISVQRTMDEAADIIERLRRTASTVSPSEVGGSKQS